MCVLITPSRHQTAETRLNEEDSNLLKLSAVASNPILRAVLKKTKTKHLSLSATKY